MGDCVGPYQKPLEVDRGLPTGRLGLQQEAASSCMPCCVVVSFTHRSPAARFDPAGEGAPHARQKAVGGPCGGHRQDAGLPRGSLGAQTMCTREEPRMGIVRTMQGSHMHLLSAQCPCAILGLYTARIKGAMRSTEKAHVVFFKIKVRKLGTLIWRVSFLESFICSLEIIQRARKSSLFLFLV